MRQRRFPSLLAALIGIVLGLAACGAPNDTVHPARPSNVPLHAQLLPGTSRPLMGGAAVRFAGKDLLVGGLNAQDLSTSTIWAFRPGHPLQAFGRLPAASHDHAAAVLGNFLWVFGGGNAYGPMASIVRIDDRGQSRVVGTLPTALSDLSALRFAGTVWVIGGYTGTTFSRVLYRFDGRELRPAAFLPVGLRYTAATTLGRDLYLIGGLTPTGPTDTVWRVRPSGQVKAVARLPVPLEQASAFVYGGRLYVVGGLGPQGAESRLVWAFNPSTNRLKKVLTLPAPYADGYLFRTGPHLWLVGGRAPNGTATDQVIELSFGGPAAR